MTRTLLAALGLGLALSACASTPPTIPPVANVDLQRFMGDWYVIAHIPSMPEREAFNAIESYQLDDEGRIRTTFQFRKGSFDAKLKTMEPVGRVVPGTNNAVWDMQFVWPIQAEYVIVDVSDDYSQTVIGRSKRDYLWIMARTPSIADADYAALVAKAKALGYDTTQLRKVPQQWPETAADARR
ncbi:lipocalin family protein [Thermomonas sp.]|uniref:lipocalin family protein n=1 Tax=Thermomonas sp. TaxID=1971895 RepID=UPI001ECD5E47|nr:lipocalin family protein [Thermomonas sp.]MBK6417536.1 lipocalin family protein [Thermomonas sp.]MBK6924758.1 lipocalin family protein [Thermomonas sp.]